MRLSFVVSLNVSRRFFAALAMSTESARLEALWNGAVDKMLDVPGSGTIVLQPAASDEESRSSFGLARPPFDVAFALTAFDPPGVERSRDANAAENAKLWQALRALDPPAVWRSFGVDLQEGWREDGFVVRAPVQWRDKILAIARDFDQGAIHEYYTTADGAMRRRTLGAKLDIDTETPMRRLSAEEAELLQTHDLMQLAWAGPPLDCDAKSQQ